MELPFLLRIPALAGSFFIACRDNIPVRPSALFSIAADDFPAIFYWDAIASSHFLVVPAQRFFVQDEHIKGAGKTIQGFL